MKKSVILFLLAIFVPSMLLGLLALRTAWDQGAALEKQAALLHQKTADELAERVRASLRNHHGEFIDFIQSLSSRIPAPPVRDFSGDVLTFTKELDFGFVLASDGTLLAPTPSEQRSDLWLARAIRANRDFFAAIEAEALYSAPLTDEFQFQKYQGVKAMRQKELLEPSSASQMRRDRKMVAAPQTALPEAKLGQTEDDSEALLGYEKKYDPQNQNGSPPEFEEAGLTNETEVLNEKLKERKSGIAFRSKDEAGAEMQVGSVSSPGRDSVGAAMGAGGESVAGGKYPADEVAPSAESSRFEDKLERVKKNFHKPVDWEILEKLSGEGVVDERGFQEGKDTDADKVPKEKSQEQKISSMALARNVFPEKQVSFKAAPARQALVPMTKARFATFSELVAEQPEGILARFANNELKIIYWAKSPLYPDLIYGVQFSPEHLSALWDDYLAGMGYEETEVVLALLDHRASPAYLSEKEFVADWKRPFVASEIGEYLPYWEACLYFKNPQHLQQSADSAGYALSALIALALGAIAFGSYLIYAETRQQVLLAQMKSDFVSNVSHELKTPLTSIRMFSEMLQEEGGADEGKKRKYLRIIALEAERLTRLINNVLDFAKMERGQKRYQKEEIDLGESVVGVWESQKLHLEDMGFELAERYTGEGMKVFADPDAIAQVMVNLLSNAEKYSLQKKSIHLAVEDVDGEIAVSVSDRGSGIPPGQEEKIFERFYRAHDSLDSGIQGSGLGLTLARRIAEDHGGSLMYSSREGGGSVLTLRLPKHEGVR